MRIQDILATGAPLQLVVDAMDLKEFFLNWKEEMVQKPQKEESPLLTPAEVTEISCFQGHFVALGQDGIAGSYQDGAQVILSSVRYRASI